LTGVVRADFWFSLVLILFGALVVEESWRMPRFAELDINPYTVPGLVPGVLGAVILLLGAILCLRSARASGWRLGALPVGRLSEPGLRRLLLAAVLCLAYAGGLVGLVPFWLATALFVAVFVALFEWPLARSGTERTRRVLFAAAFGIVISAVVTLVFQHVFLVRLP
jgi:hypothetical protein